MATGNHASLLLLLLLSFGSAHSRSILGPQPPDPVSDGASPAGGRPGDGPPYLLLPRSSSSAAADDDSSCDQTYGFMPCTTSWLGNLFLILVYGYLMFTAATYLSNGSELLLEILGPGIVGGLFLPILGALPDAMLILVSGLSGSSETAQSQVSVGMGLLAGSTVMLLTVIWGSCVIVGKCDIHDSVALDKQDTKGFSLKGSGVSTDLWTSYAARIMVFSVIPFIIVQLPQILNSTSGRHLAVLISLIVSLILLMAYCIYQVVQPWIQKRRLAYVEHKHVVLGFLRHLRTRALGRLLTDDGELNKDVVEKLFRTLDENGDGYLSAAELKALIVGIQLEEIDLNEDDAVDKVMKDFDSSNDFLLELPEFVDGISRWLNKARSSGAASGIKNFGSMKFLDDLHHQSRQEHAKLKAGDQTDEVSEPVENTKLITLKAVLLLVLGTIVAGAFADPLVDAVDNFSDASGIPTFFISFIALPLATNSSEAVSAIIFASRKKQRTASLTFSELYGAVTMNNLLCLSVFLAIVYIRGLTWDFSSEVLVILIVCFVMGTFASFRTTFPLWTFSLAFLLYPFSLALVYVLDYICGWS
ncbi:sodium/calcium exchanger NCL-like [Rhodamnia argentea]|uniref:Sodium/calcium exchanger NCL-like n=1 Tax=Rhodamnia argentea TaxID=178133 RepID=A0A8B8QV07_9MYRT|nr:sodium/calcium exchanger NCL-like [Rhodamnia argentea]XP_048130109.1 sodium/calcium exchanger NCL-like [Rhodamnia argentea]